MLRIGLTGGIAAGKSLVSNMLGDLGAVVIDADVLAREVVEPGTAGFGEILDRFGGHLVLADGSLDRARLGELVFEDADARRVLNDIVHPRVRAAAGVLEREAPSDAVVVHVIPLLVETGQQDAFDAVLVVDVPQEVQMDRLMERNSLTREQALARLAAQASREDRLVAADWTIENTGDVEATGRAVRDLWRGPIAELRRGRGAAVGT